MIVVDRVRYWKHFARMKYRLLVLACITGPAFGQPTIDPPPSNLAYRLEYAKRDAAANHDCPSRTQRRYAADFERRYGERIKRLTEVHVARVGPDPDFVILADCRGTNAAMAVRNARHREAMEDFEPTLRSLEREFGGY